MDLGIYLVIIFITVLIMIPWVGFIVVPVILVLIVPILAISYYRNSIKKKKMIKITPVKRVTGKVRRVGRKSSQITSEDLQLQNEDLPIDILSSEKREKKPESTKTLR